MALALVASSEGVRGRAPAAGEPVVWLELDAPTATPTAAAPPTAPVASSAFARGT